MTGHRTEPGRSQNSEHRANTYLDDGRMSPVCLDLSHRHVCVTGIRDGFIEFQFTLADPMLTIELVMPPEAFDAFCHAQQASVSAAEGINMTLTGLRAGQS